MVDNIKHNFFDKWTEESAYICGFIIADGYIKHKDYCSHTGYSVAFCQHYKDREILKFIKQTLNAKPKIRHYNKILSDGIRRNQAHFQFSSKQIVNKLMSFGIIPRKTGKECIPKTLPDKFFFDFLRGLFDGDGCVRIYTQICNNKKYPAYCFKLSSANPIFLEEIKKRTKITIGKISLYANNCYCWQVTAKNNMKYIYKKMYHKNYKFALKRKYKKFSKIMNI